MEVYDKINPKYFLEEENIENFLKELISENEDYILKVKINDVVKGIYLLNSESLYDFVGTEISSIIDEYSFRIKIHNPSRNFRDPVSILLKKDLEFNVPNSFDLKIQSDDEKIEMEAYKMSVLSDPYEIYDKLSENGGVRYFEEMWSIDEEGLVEKDIIGPYTLKLNSFVKNRMSIEDVIRRLSNIQIGNELYGNIGSESKNYVIAGFGITPNTVGSLVMVKIQKL